MGRKTEKVLGYDVDLLTCNEAVNLVSNNMFDRKGMHIVTINPEMIQYAPKNRVFSRIIRAADLVVPDGVGITLALLFKGVKQEQVRGIDLAKSLIEECENANYEVGLIGSTQNVIETTVKRLSAEFKMLKITYFRNGFFTQNQENEIIEDLAKKNPRFVLVALGAPKQEIFISKCREKMPNTVFIGVGGTFDVWAGAVKRAPEFFQITGTEWLFRLFSQPKRFKRIVSTLPVFFVRSLIYGLKYRFEELRKRKNNE